MNLLNNSTSPYLLQHADNPVNWLPWSEEAFLKAKQEDKPIFLSIGYSTCHWCHVMAHESFEDQEVANLLNEAFVCVKVDREERPDLDAVYMQVVQMLTGRGGWPMTVVLTPDKQPFFGGTYFPKTTRYGRVGMLDLVPRIKEIWKTRRDEVYNSAASITKALQSASGIAPGDELSESVLAEAFESLKRRFDKKYGGFGSAPKFPTPHNLMFLLRYWKRYKDNVALEIVEKTLEAMRLGGICDQLGFGFHRYSTDKEWLLPHFEKMLYDQALLAMAYTEAYQATQKDFYSQAAQEIFTYVLRDLCSEEGVFFSAEDADSEGEEGKFYFWTKAEIKSLCSFDETNDAASELADWEIFCKVFNIKEEGNFSDEASGEQTGNNIPHLSSSIMQLATEFGLSAEDLTSKIEKIRQKLFLDRKKRVHPFKDDKSLTDWNGLMIAALAKGAKTFNNDDYSEVAMKAADFLLTKMRSPDGSLHHSSRAGQFQKESFLDDYAFLIWGLIELYEATFKINYLQEALKLTQHLTDNFWDEENGAYFFNAHNSEKLITRHKEIYDGAIPSGNSVMMLNLQKLSLLTGQQAFQEQAIVISKTFSKQVADNPTSHTQLLNAVDLLFGPAKQVCIVGDLQNDQTQLMLKTLNASFEPNMVTLLKPLSEAKEISNLLQPLQDKELINNQTTAYICVNGSCSLPVNEL